MNARQPHRVGQNDETFTSGSLISKQQRAVDVACLREFPSHPRLSQSGRIPVGLYQARMVIERNLTDDVNDAAKLHPTLPWENGSPCFLSDHTPHHRSPSSEIVKFGNDILLATPRGSKICRVCSCLIYRGYSPVRLRRVLREVSE
jgi:hypothetical protein